MDAYVYEMGDIIKGEINQAQTSTWYAILRDTSSNNIAVQSLFSGKVFSLSSASASKVWKVLRGCNRFFNLTYLVYYKGNLHKVSD